MPKKKVKKSRKRTAAPELKAPYFIGVGDPVELRKHILEPTREVIQFLQSYEEFKKTKEEKTQAISQLKDDLRLIKVEINRLRKLLPPSRLQAAKSDKKVKAEIRKEPKAPFQEEARPLPKPLPKPGKVKTPPELESLEKELGEIEKKLGTIPD